MSGQTLEITLNGEPCGLEDHALQGLLKAKTHHGQSFAVAVNGRFVPASAYADTRLCNGDRVEILIPMQGG